MQQIEREIWSVIAEQLHVVKERVTPDLHLAKDLGADSLAIVRLIMTIEDRWELDIPDEDMEEMRTVGQLTKYVELAMGERAWTRVPR